MVEPGAFGDRYEVVRTISEGDRASVVHAVDRLHERPVALKVHRLLGQDRERMLAEAQVLMGIAPHPGLPVVQGDFFTEDQQHYVLVMKWVDGTDLQQILDDEGDPGLPLDEVLDDLTQVAEALDHLHTHDPPIIHGDVKPSNIVRTPKGKVVLVDFDIAGAIGAGRVGTTGFVAPEVAAGDKPTPAADIFGLGATALTLLTGSPPESAGPAYSGVDAGTHGAVMRPLRSALATDPDKRPRTATKLLQSMRAGRISEPPSGVVALLAVGVADAARLWAADPEEMRATLVRLRDIRDQVVEHRGGHVVTSMNESDRTIVVFREASAAARAALELHARVEHESFPPGFEVRLRAALAVGEAARVDGAYTGAVVDHVLGLRSAAQPGTTVTSEATAELLLELVGREISIVPVGRLQHPELPHGARVFAITPPGLEYRVGSASAIAGPVETAPEAVSDIGSGISRMVLLRNAFEHSTTLTLLTIAGVSLIFRLVLSSELGLGSVAGAVFAVSLAATLVSVRWQYSRSKSTHEQLLTDARLEREGAAQRRAVAEERAETRRRLEAGFTRLANDDGRACSAILEALADEFDRFTESVRRPSSNGGAATSRLLPNLVDDTYRHGMSALSDALELFETTSDSQHRRLGEELDAIESRLANDDYADDGERARDVERQASRRQLLDRQRQSRQRARDLAFEAERCTAAIAEARIEAASIRVDDKRVGIDAVVESLQSTIVRVRDIQDEFRRMGNR